MARQTAISIENNFRNGLITEASGFNFPENACVETYNCEFDVDGSVYRRLGFDFETNYELKEIAGNVPAVKVTYLWKNVAGNGDVTVLVTQIGDKLYFYELISDRSFSSGVSVSAVTLTPVSGATNSGAIEAQFSDGNGFLFVTHPLCETLRVSYDIAAHTATATTIVIKIRDFEGAVADPYAVDERPTATLAGLNVNHNYNLRNQGWSQINLEAWDTAQTTMPSNADVMWRFKDTSDNFDASAAAIARVTAGNSPAPKGHFVLELSNQGRDAASGLTGVAASGTGSKRPSTSAFFAGRVFYAGINTTKYNSNIYFTQIIERDDQYGAAYQVNDPTAEDLFDLLPSDGGVISIPEAGTIYKLFTVPGGLSVFAENGVWFITGSSGIGFIANDYTVQKIANIPVLTASSFVNVAGYPSWWNSEGIYLMIAQGNLPQIQSISEGKIKSFFKDIPLNSKRFAKGIYHYVDGHIRWIYRSTNTDQINETYEYDRVLNFNVQTGAFYPWTITASDVKVNSIVVSDTISGNIAVDTVITELGDDVVDAAGGQVIAFSSSTSESIPFDKYLVSYFDGVNQQFTFASKINASYLDWFTYDLEERSYSSYFITGYKLRGQGIRKFQVNWLRVFSRLTTPVSYYFQGLWDYALTGSGTGRWSVKQYISHDDMNYAYQSRRLKVRGHGLVLQFRVESIPKEAFDIVGWVSQDSGNATP